MIASRRSIKGRIFTLLLFLQAALVVTGGAVRLTGSGLGCPTWPECTPGSYTPVPHQAEGQLHAWIEFGNRLLTFLLLFTAVAALTLTIRLSKNLLNKKRLRVLAFLQVLGIFGQGILGGITVLTDLNPIPVAGHYLLSIVLIAGASSLRFEIVGYEKQSVTPIVQLLIRLQIFLTIAVLIAGTIVTGSGPHAGDENSKRFGFNTQMVSIIHADLVIALVVLVLITYLIARQDSQSILPRLKLFILTILIQGVIGYVQYFTGLPELIVGFHLLGSTLVWIAAWSLFKVLNIKLISGEATK
jgi:cytochrome c oxidase assembly protein subunit 15